MIKNYLNQIISSQNRFFKLAKDAKRLPHIAFSSFLLPLLFIAAGLLLTQFAIVPLTVGDIKQLPNFYEELFMLFVPFILVVFTIFLWVKFFEKRSFYTIGFTKENLLRKYLFGFGTGVLMMSLIVGLMALTGTIVVNQNSRIGSEAIGGVILFLFAYIIQGGAEEISTRGWQFQVIGARYKPWIGALVSSLFFTVMHLTNKGVNVLCLINLFLFAVLLVSYVMNDGSIWSACGWHSAWNWTLGNVFGLKVSGIHGGTVSLLNLSASGPDFITGGPFGPEGSIFATFIFSTGILWMTIYIYRKNKQNNDLLNVCL